ncbi:MAG: pilin [Patescibacteria group bacterium]
MAYISNSTDAVQFIQLSASMRMWYYFSWFMRTGFIKITVFLAMLLLPMEVLALTFNCCNCKTESKAAKLKEFCALIPNTKDCAFAAAEINKQTGNKFSLTCDNLSYSLCTKIEEKKSGKCVNDPEAYDKINESYITLKDAEGGVKATGTAPTLGVSIPGVQFPSSLTIKDNRIQIPYLAIYVSALHKYLVGAGLIAAALMIIYGGFLYLLSSTGAKVREGKEVIKDSLAGLAIILFSVVMLGNINPNTVTSGALQLTVVKAPSTPENVDEARKMVEDAAKIRWADEGIVKDDYAEGEVDSVYRPEDDISRDGVGRPVVQECPGDMVPIPYVPGWKVQGKGNAVDISSFCMDKFEAPNIGPTGNNAGRKPYYGVIPIEAAWWCDQRNKRLCTYNEWIRACLGPQGTNTYGYGPVFRSGSQFYKINPRAAKPADAIRNEERAPCNYDSDNPHYSQDIAERDKRIGGKNKDGTVGFGLFYPTIADGSILTPESENSALANETYSKAYYALKEWLDSINVMVEPSGSRIECRTAEGVYDMPGNVAEIVLRSPATEPDKFKNMPITQLESYDGSTKNSDSPYQWLNFYWSPVAHLGEKGAGLVALPVCTYGAGSTHVMAWRAFENGFRCCVDWETEEESRRKAEAKALQEAAKAEEEIKKQAKKDRTDICGTTGATEGMTCIKLGKDDTEGGGPGQYTCLKGYCMAVDSSAKYCCKQN